MAFYHEMNHQQLYFIRQFIQKEQLQQQFKHMQTSQANESPPIPPLHISSIGKSKNQTNAQSQRYNRQHLSLFLLKSRFSASTLKQGKKPLRKTSEKRIFHWKINSTLDFIGSNIIPCQIVPKNMKKVSFFSTKTTKQSNIQANQPQIVKKFQQTQRKAKLLAQLVKKYKFNKSTQKGNLRQPFTFPTEPAEFHVPKPSSKSNKRKFSIQQKEKSKIRISERQLPNNAFPVDPEIKVIVQNQILKIWKLKNQKMTKERENNILNYYQRSKYENKIKNIKIVLKK